MANSVMRVALVAVALPWSVAVHAAAHDTLPNLPATSYAAESLDRQGKLLQALPLYRGVAAQTQTTADQLRYAGALLRAGRVEEGKAIYDQVAGRNAAVCASSLLVNGFPAHAVDYARAAYAGRPESVSLALLLIRAHAAAGDMASARMLVQALGDPTSAWVVGQRIEFARWQLATGGQLPT
ncbi:MAG TPA: hypothetical protein VMT89_01035, partial [Candidatus Acidoferrales bacterium]|nr:hypothetical protein [Candidatus Acidoferrales bacterium]